MDETPAAVPVAMPMWYDKFTRDDGTHFKTAQEFTSWMTENRKWGPHRKPMTHEEWEAIKAKAHADTGADLGTAQFVPGKGSLGDGKLK